MQLIKKLLIPLFFLMPLTALAATAAPWSITNVSDTFIFPNLFNGVAKGILVSASSTINSTLTVSSLTNGNCVQAGTGGLLTTTGTPCSSSSSFGTSSLSAVFPIIYTQSASLAQFSFGGLTTSTPAVVGNIPYFTGVNTFGNVATGTITCSGTASCGAGSSVIGSALTITGTGLSSYDAFTHPAAGQSATTSLLITTGGLISSASSTIGSGTQIGGLTISGGATTTGFLAVQGSGTSTFAGGVNLTGTDCFATQGTCLQTFIQNATAYKQAANYATAAVLAGTPTYSNGSSGVGATLTEVGAGALSIDGQAPSAGQRVLIKNQADQTTNGIYTVTAAGSGIASYILTRATDYNTSNDVYAGTTVPILVGGTVNGDTQWTESTTGTIVIGTSNIVFIETSFGTSGTVTSVATGLGLSGGPITTTGTITLASSSIFTGTTGQVPYFSATNALIGTSTIFITTGSNVGIGTANPTAVNANAKLTVAGIGSQDIIASTTDSTTLSDAIVQVYSDASRLFMGSHGSQQVSTRYGLTLGSWGEITEMNNIAATPSAGLVIGTNPAVPLLFGTNNLERARFLSTGQLGIGSTTPFAQLAIHAFANATFNPVIFAIASSSPTATTTTFSIFAKGSMLMPEYTISPTSTSQTVDWQAGNQQLFRYGTSAITITFTNVVAGGKLTLVTCSPGAGTAGAITFAGGHYSGGVQPGNTTTSNQCDLWYWVGSNATSTSEAILTGMTPGVF